MGSVCGFIKTVLFFCFSSTVQLYLVFAKVVIIREQAASPPQVSQLHHLQQLQGSYHYLHLDGI